MLLLEVSKATVPFGELSSVYHSVELMVDVQKIFIPGGYASELDGSYHRSKSLHFRELNQNPLLD